jgi:hypothetical protein
VDRRRRGRLGAFLGLGCHGMPMLAPCPAAAAE